MAETSLKPLRLLCGSDRPMVIAGPCAAESEEQVLTVGRQLRDLGFRVMRAGAWKPRTKPGGFEGFGEQALPWLSRARRELGLQIAVEVATPQHVEQALRHDIDIFWLGARTTANPFVMQAIADALRGVDVPVLVKNPINPDIDLWIGAFERLAKAGVERLAAVHRGFSSYGEKVYRNSPMWSIPIELHRRVPRLTMFCDPSHMGGRRQLIAPLCQEAMNLGFDGLIVECHNDPASALSDAHQQVTPAELRDIIDGLVLPTRDDSAADLAHLRSLIDEADSEIIALLARRMEVSAEIGRLKKSRNMAPYQPSRYAHVLRERMEWGAGSGLSDQFIKAVYELIHEESLRRQQPR